MPHRDRYTIKTEIDEAQQDLEHNLHELRNAVGERVDVKGKVERKLDEKRAQAMDVAVRIREIGIDVSTRARRFVREHPGALVGALAGVLVVSGLVLKIRRELRASEELLGEPEWLVQPDDVVLIDDVPYRRIDRPVRLAHRLR